MVSENPGSLQWAVKLRVSLLQSSIHLILTTPVLTWDRTATSQGSRGYQVASPIGSCVIVPHHLLSFRSKCVPVSGLHFVSVSPLNS
jgi:hypothetical protein